MKVFLVIEAVQCSIFSHLVDQRRFRPESARVFPIGYLGGAGTALVKPVVRFAEVNPPPDEYVLHPDMEYPNIIRGRYVTKEFRWSKPDSIVIAPPGNNLNEEYYREQNERVGNFVEDQLVSHEKTAESRISLEIAQEIARAWHSDFESGFEREDDDPLYADLGLGLPPTDSFGIINSIEPDE